MTNRERFRAAMAFESTDRPCHIEHGFWPATYQRWLGEGLPAGVREPPFAYLGEGPDLFDHFEAYLRRTIKDLYDRRGRFWSRDFSSPEAYARSVEPNRQHFLNSLGGWPWERQDVGLRIEPIEDFPAFRLERVTYRLLDTIDTDALLEDVAAHVPRYMIPKVVEVVDELPKTSSGKIDYPSLHRRASAKVASSPD